MTDVGIPQIVIYYKWTFCDLFTKEYFRVPEMINVIERYEISIPQLMSYIMPRNEYCLRNTDAKK